MAESLVVKIGADISGLDAGIQNATRTVSGFGDTLKGAFLGSLGADMASRAFAAITESITGAIHALAEVDKIAGQTAAVIASTGGAAGVSADQVGQLADALERKTGIEAESIAKGENLLLTFTNIKNAAGANNDIFNQATGIMADLATAMGGDASGAAIQLGKALNDPTAGVTALTRVGVTFTDVQKAQIKAMQDAGDLMGAQKIVLAELRKEFGGSAEAAGKTFAGALDRAKNAVDSISEAMVGPAVPVFTRALGKVADAAYAVSDAITKGDLIGLINRSFGPGSKALVVGLAAVIGASLVPQMANVTRQAAVMAASYLRATASMVYANAPLVTAIATVSFAAYPFIKNWDTVAGLFSLTWTNITNAVNSAWQTISGATRNALEIISANFRAAYSNVMAFFLGPLARGFKTLFDALPKQVKDTLGGIKFEMPKFEMMGAGAAFQSLKDAATPAFKYVSALAGTTVENFKATWGGLPGEIKGILSEFNGLVAGSTSGAANQLRTIGDAAGQMGDQVKDGHEKAAKGVKAHGDATKKLASDFMSAIPALFQFILRAGEVKKLLETKIKGDIFAEAMGKISDLDKISKYWNDTAKNTSTAMNILEGAINDMIMRGVDRADPKIVALREKYDALNKALQESKTKHLDAGQVVEDAKKKLEDIDKVAKYWNDTSDKTAEKQSVLRDAMNLLTTTGIDPQGIRIAELRKLFDLLGIKMDENNAKTVTFGQALGAIGGIVGATSATLAYFGGSDSPIAQVLEKVTGGINLFNQWGTAITTASTVLTNLGGVTGVFGAILNAALAPVTLIGVGIGLLVWAAHDAATAFGGWPKVFTVAKMAFVGLGLGLAKVGEFIVGGVINVISGAWVGLINLMRSGANVIIDSINAAIRGINALGGNMAEIGRFDMIEFKPVELTWSAGLAEQMKGLQAELDAAPKPQEWKVSNPLEAIGGLFKETDKKVKDATENPVEKLTKTIDQIDKQMAIFGQSDQLMSEKRSAFKAAIDDLIRQGVDPAAESIKMLKAKFDELEPIKPVQKEFNQAYQGMVSGANALMQRAIDTGDEALKKRAAEAYQSAIREGTQAKPEAPPIVINYNGTGKWTREDVQQLGSLLVGELKTSGVR